MNKLRQFNREEDLHANVVNLSNNDNFAVGNNLKQQNGKNNTSNNHRKGGGEPQHQHISLDLSSPVAKIAHQGSSSDRNNSR